MRIALTLCALMIAVAGVAKAAPAPYPLAIDSRNLTAPALTLYQASPRTIRVTFTDGTNAMNITGETPIMSWATNAYAGGIYTASYSVVSATTGIVDFTFSAGALNHTPGRFLYEVGVSPTVIRQGALTLLGSPYGAGATVQSLTSNINAALYTWLNFPWPAGIYGTNGLFGGGTTGVVTLALTPGVTSGLPALVSASTSGIPAQIAAMGAAVTNPVPGWISAAFGNNPATNVSIGAYYTYFYQSDYLRFVENKDATSKITNALRSLNGVPFWDVDSGDHGFYLQYAGTSNYLQGMDATLSSLQTAGYLTTNAGDGLYVRHEGTNLLNIALTNEAQVRAEGDAALGAFTNAADTALQPADTNGWTVTSHAGLVSAYGSASSISNDADNSVSLLNSALTRLFYIGPGYADGTPTAYESIAIGEQSTAEHGGVAVGWQATVLQEGVSVGELAQASQTDIAIGPSARAKSGAASIALGAYAQASNQFSFALGGSGASKAIAAANYAGQIGPGANFSEATVNYLSNRVADAYGLSLYAGANITLSRDFTGVVVSASAAAQTNVPLSGILAQTPDAGGGSATNLALVQAGTVEANSLKGSAGWIWQSYASAGNTATLASNATLSTICYTGPGTNRTLRYVYLEVRYQVDTPTDYGLHTNLILEAGLGGAASTIVGAATELGFLPTNGTYTAQAGTYCSWVYGWATNVNLTTAFGAMPSLPAFRCRNRIGTTMSNITMCVGAQWAP